MRATTESKSVTVTKNPIMRRNLTRKLEASKSRQFKAVAQAIYEAGSITMIDLVQKLNATFASYDPAQRMSVQKPERIVRYYVSVLKTKKFVSVQ